jgi:hypothetical protein
LAIHGKLQRLVIDLIESVKREVQTLDRKVSEGFARIETKFDTQGARMDRQAALAQKCFDKLEKRYGDPGPGTQPDR